MRMLVSGLAMIAVSLTSDAVLAACGDDPADGAAIATARAAVDSTCDCAGTSTHDVYVRCARDIVRDRVDHRLLSLWCRSTVLRCARRSTCGRPDAVTCCRTTSRGPRCNVRRTVEHCTGSRGCVGTFTSCCDACGGGGCVTTSTTTTTTLVASTCGPSQFPACGGACPTGEQCVAFVISEGGGTQPTVTCLCASTSQACGDFDPDSGFLNCGAGPCPGGACVFSFLDGICGCVYP